VFQRISLIALAIICALGFVSSPLHAQEKTEQPVKIYVLVGQSNMQGKASIEGEDTGSLAYTVKNDPDKQYPFLVDEDGQWVEREDVWIYLDQAPMASMYSGLKPGYGSFRGQIGPELGFGHTIGEASDEQVLLIKACWGGKSLGNDFLSPSVGNYAKPMQPGDPGFYYHEILRIVKDVTENIGTYFPDYEGQGIELAGLGYHQGWNDQYGGLDQKYETNLAAFIKDIRSTEHGLGVPDLPVVIATSGNIRGESPIKQGQSAMGDTDKYPQFAGNVSVVDTDKPYGPDEMTFKFYTKKSPQYVGYHWNLHARSYLNIGIAMAREMLKLDKPKLPSRLVAIGHEDGVELTWQLGSEKPDRVELRRNATPLENQPKMSQTAFVDTTAQPGTNRYELVLHMPSGKQVFNVASDTSVTDLTAYRGVEGVMLSWQARGKYEGFKITRDDQIVVEEVSGDLRSFEDTRAPASGTHTYRVEPTTGNATAAAYELNLGPIESGGAVIYEPFDYPADTSEPLNIIGKGGAIGTKGVYAYLNDKQFERAAAALPGGLHYGSLPVTGNHAGTHRWGFDTVIELDDSLEKAGLLEDGATMWMSYIFYAGEEHELRRGGGNVTLLSDDLKQGVGFEAMKNRYVTVVVKDGEVGSHLITGMRPKTPTLVVGKITWGKDGEPDSFVSLHVGPDLKRPEKYGRAAAPFDIDQSKLSRLVLSGEGQFDEIRVGPTFESVIGAGDGKHAEATQSKEEPAQENASPKNLDIYLLIGQSNMAGRAKVTEELAGAIEGCLLLDGKNQWIPAKNPLNLYSTVRKPVGFQKLGPGYSFAKAMVEAETGNTIGLIVNARGATVIEQWHREGKFYTELIKRAKAVEEAGVIKGILWHQGEGNAPNPEEYLDQLKALVANLREDLGDKNLPFVAGQIKDTPDLKEINDVLAQLPEVVTNTATVSSKGLKCYDRWHFDTDSQIELGRRYAEAMLKLQATSKINK
jgi:hypothetical protein